MIKRHTYTNLKTHSVNRTISPPSKTVQITDRIVRPPPIFLFRLARRHPHTLYNDWLPRVCRRPHHQVPALHELLVIPIAIVVRRARVRRTILINWSIPNMWIPRYYPI